MSATRALLARPAPLNGSSLATRWRTARAWQAPAAAAQGKLQRAAYAIPPQDKHNDDLGGPYGQEHPNPAERKKVNSKGFASQAAVGIAMVVGFGVVFSVFASPRAIAEHQIENDKQLGSYRSNTGASLQEAKYGNGGVGGHALHREQTLGK